MAFLTIIRSWFKKVLVLEIALYLLVLLAKKLLGLNIWLY